MLAHLVDFTMPPIITLKCRISKIQFTKIQFLARNAFVRTNRRAISTVFVHPSVSPPVCLSAMSVGYIVITRCTVHFSADLSLWLDSPMFWAL